MKGVFVFVIGVVLSGCATEPSTPNDEPDFFARTEQLVRDRIVKAHIRAVDSLNLSAYEIYQPQGVRKYRDRLYVFDRGSGRIAAFDEAMRGAPVFIGKGKGEGPGEVNGISDFQVSRDGLYLFLRRRTIVWSTSGKFISDKTRDVGVYRGEVLGPGNTLVSDPTSSGYLFNIVNEEGKTERGFVRTDLGRLTPLHYEGDLAFDGEHLYFAGVPESLIKKYTLDGRQLFSVATIDNYPGEINYVQFGGDGGRMAMGYAPGALFSTAMIEVYDGYLLAVPIHDYDQSTLSYIDVYDAEDGRYVATYDLARMPQSLAVDAEGVYTLEYEGNDAYLKRYGNFLPDLERSRPERFSGTGSSIVK
ncbi:hypothetical protein [Rhodocaloribacter sp.]